MVSRAVAFSESYRIVDLVERSEKMQFKEVCEKLFRSRI